MILPRSRDRSFRGIVTSTVPALTGDICPDFCRGAASQSGVKRRVPPSSRRRTTDRSVMGLQRATCRRLEPDRDGVRGRSGLLLNRDLPARLPCCRARLWCFAVLRGPQFLVDIVQASIGSRASKRNCHELMSIPPRKRARPRARPWAPRPPHLRERSAGRLILVLIFSRLGRRGWPRRSTGPMIEASPIGTPNYRLGTDELGRDIARVIGRPASRIIGILP